MPGYSHLLHHQNDELQVLFANKKKCKYQVLILKKLEKAHYWNTANASKVHQNEWKGTKRATTTSCCVRLCLEFWNLTHRLWRTFLATTSKPHQYATSEDAFSGAVIKREKKRLWQVYYFQRPEEMEPLLRSPLQKIDVSSPSEVLNAPKMYGRLWLSLIPLLTLHWGVRK